MSGIYKAVKQGTNNIVKIFKGIELKWEAFIGKTITFYLKSSIPPNSSLLEILDDVRFELSHKKILKVQIGNLPSIDGGQIRGVTEFTNATNIYFSKDFETLTNSYYTIKAGTQVTIWYE